MRTSKDCYIGYFRKSTDTEDKQVLSLDSQAEVVREFAKSRGLYIPKHFELRESYSAKKPGTREIFKYAVKILKDGQAKGIISYKADRLTRNYGDLQTLIELLEKNIEVWATDFGRYTNDANGTMILGFNALMAKRKIDDLSEDTKRGLQMKVLIKEWPGVAANGYLNLDEKGRIAGKLYDPKLQRLLDNLGRKLERIEPHPLKAHFIPRAFNLYLVNQHSLKSLATKLNEEGCTGRNGGPLTKSSLEAILKNPFYCGIKTFKDKIVHWKHQPLITKTLFDLVQEKLKMESPFKFHQLDHTFTYGGLLHCGSCGCLITVEKKVKKQKNGNVHSYVYYHCTHSKACPQKGCIEETELEKQLVDIFQEFTLSQQMADFVQAKLKELFEEDIRYQETNEKALTVRLAKLRDEKKKLYRKLVNDQIKDEAMVEELKKDIDAEITQAEERLESITKHTKDYLEQTSNLLYLAQNAKQLFLEGTREQKHVLLNSVASNLFLKDKKVYFSLKKPFDVLAKGSKRPIQLRLMDNVRTWCIQSYYYSSFPSIGINEVV